MSKIQFPGLDVEPLVLQFFHLVPSCKNHKTLSQLRARLPRHPRATLWRDLTTIPPASERRRSRIDIGRTDDLNVNDFLCCLPASATPLFNCFGLNSRDTSLFVQTSNSFYASKAALQCSHTPAGATSFSATTGCLCAAQCCVMVDPD